MYNSAYVQGINNLYEKDCGQWSGWMYEVNGWYQTMDAAVTRYRTGTTSNGIIPVTWEETWEQACLN